jgi:hypothetical protein
MGWSATQAACATMDRLTARCIAQTASQNMFKLDGNSYFWETGREQDDGAITGTITKLIGDIRAESCACARAGTFRIEPNGQISRGGLLKRLLTLKI